MTDWGDGHYELTAIQLAPSAEQLLQRATIVPDEMVLDLGCGTGNVTLLAAARGARVTAIDPASRLLEVTAAEARQRGYDVAVANGCAEAIPAESGTFDVVLSHFALVFADDESTAMQEVRRVLRADGRLLFTAWVAEGAIHEAMVEFGQAMEAATSSPPTRRFAWRDPEAVRDLVSQRFRRVEVERGTIAFEAPSVQAFVDGFLNDHPLGRACAKTLGTAGTLEATRQRATEILEAASETAARLYAVSPYVTITATGCDS